MTTEESLREIMIQKCGSVKEFAAKANLPPETVYAILRRGVLRAGLSNILQICETLGISADGLAVGKIVPVDESYRQKTEIEEVLHFFLGNLDGVTLDGIKMTEEEIRSVEDAIESALFIIRRRRS